MKTTIKSPVFVDMETGRKVTLEIVLDSEEIFPDDPGQGTPAMVILRDTGRELDSGTYWCATGEGELSHNGTRLTGDQLDWLFAQQEQVDRFVECQR